MLILDEYQLQAWRLSSRQPLTSFSQTQTIASLQNTRIYTCQNLEREKFQNLDIEECELGDSNAMGPPLHAQGPHPHSSREKAHSLQSINQPKPGKPYLITKCKRNLNKKLNQPPRSQNTMLDNQHFCHDQKENFSS